MVEYLVQPLQDAMNDENAYVRKTAALCVAKVYEVNSERVESIGLLRKLQDMLMDGNGMVVSNATAAIAEIQQTKGLWF
jgi:AP-1 complex subunit beta-1